MNDHEIRNLTDDELIRFASNSRPDDNLVRELADRLDERNLEIIEEDD
jgi:hypothetical protein